jgi:hypothetical protein
MTHWDTQSRLGDEHRADLDREAARAALVSEARATKASPRRTRILDTLIEFVSRLQWRRSRTSRVAAHRRALQPRRDTR